MALVKCTSLFPRGGGKVVILGIGIGIGIGFCSDASLWKLNPGHPFLQFKEVSPKM